MSARSVINWAIISGYGRPPLQNSNMAGNNWESWDGRGSDVIRSRQQKQPGYFSMRQVSSWKVFAVVFLRIRSKFELNSSVTRVCKLVVVLCRIATTVQTRKKWNRRWHLFFAMKGYNLDYGLEYVHAVSPIHLALRLVRRHLNSPCLVCRK